MVFEVGTEEMLEDQDGNSSDTLFVKAHTLARIVSNLNRGGLETRMFYSQDRTLVFLKIRASLERFCSHADQIDYKLRMEDLYVREKLAAGKLSEDGRSFVWSPKQYSDALSAKAEDDLWSAANYFRGESATDTFEYMIIRDDDKENALLPEHEKRAKVRVYPIRDDLQQCPYKYYQYHYGKYDDDYAFDGPRGMYQRDLRSGSPFRGVDRLKLLVDIFETDVSEKGCGLDIGKLLAKGCMLACFPLHDEDMIIEIQNGWMVPWKMPWDMDKGVEKIRGYYGEKIGLYFKFICTYTKWLAYAAGGGVIGFLFVCIETTGFYGIDRGDQAGFGTYRTHGSSIVVLPVALMMCLWSSRFLENWKTEQITCAMKWGMVGFEEGGQKDRPEFKINPDNVVINDPINGKRLVYFPDEEKFKRKVRSYLLIFFLIVLVCLGVMAVFFVKALVDPNQCVKQVVEDDPPDGFDFVEGQEYGKPTMLCMNRPFNVVKIGPYPSVGIPEIPLGGMIAAIANAVNILIFNAIYGYISVYLNDYENHRTDLEYEDELIMKTFVFQMVNSYGALTYIAFLKEPVVNRLPGMDIYAMCPFEFKEVSRGRSCFSELGTQLFAIFVTKVIVDNSNNIMQPYFISSRRQGDEAEEEAELDDPDGDTGEPPMKRMKSLVEIEYDRKEYDVTMGPFDDYKELVIQFGYATIFFTAFPMAPLMAFLANYMQIRFDLYKLCQLSRRAEPRHNEDVGSWESILRVIGTIAVVSNCALIVFTSGYLKDYQRGGPFPALNSSPAPDQEKSRSVQGYKWLLFFLLEHLLIIMKMLIDLASPDVPGVVEIQIARQELVESKLINNEPSEADDSDEEEDLLDGVPDKKIWQDDNDVTLKEHAKEEYKMRQRRFARAQGALGGDNGAEENAK